MTAGFVCYCIGSCLMCRDIFTWISVHLISPIVEQEAGQEVGEIDNQFLLHAFSAFICFAMMHMVVLEGSTSLCSDIYSADK